MLRASVRLCSHSRHSRHSRHKVVNRVCRAVALSRCLAIVLISAAEKKGRMSNQGPRAPQAPEFLGQMPRGFVTTSRTPSTALTESQSRLSTLECLRLLLGWPHHLLLRLPKYIRSLSFIILLLLLLSHPSFRITDTLILARVVLVRYTVLTYRFSSARMFKLIRPRHPPSTASPNQDYACIPR